MRFIFILTDTKCFVVEEDNGHILYESVHPTLDDFLKSDGAQRLEHNTKSPIHLFLDTQDQRYIWEKSPQINPLSKKRFLKNKCAPHCKRTHHKTYIERPGGNLLFVDTHITENQLDWVHFLEQRKNPLNKPRILSLETEQLFSQEAFSRIVPNTPYIILSYTHPHGLRQTLFHRQSFYLNRLAHLGAKNLKPTIEAEMGHLVHYLTQEMGLPLKEIGVLHIGHPLKISALPEAQQAFLQTQNKGQSTLSFSALAFLASKVAQKKPRLNLNLKAMQNYQRQAVFSKILMGASVLCTLTLFWGGLYLYVKKESLRRSIEEQEGALKAYDHRLKTVPPLNTYKAFEPQNQKGTIGLLEYYDRLKRGILNPETMLEAVSPWLKRHWMLRNFEWTYVSPKFKRESWVLDTPLSTHESMDLWLDYLGPKHLQDQARTDQIRAPLKGYDVKAKTRMKEFDVIQITGKGVDL